jgi:hypothetical protein
MSVPGRLVAVQITKYTPISPNISRDVITYLRYLACKTDLNAETHPAVLQPVCESMFSITGFMLNGRRSSLTPHNFNRLIFIHDNAKVPRNLSS